MNNRRMDVLDKHLKQWKQISGRLQKQLASVLEMQKTIERSLRPVIELQKAIQSPLEPFLKEQKKLQKMFDGIKLLSYQLPNLPLYTKQIDQYQKALRSIISPAFKELQHSFKELPQKTQKALLLLAKQGWYLDFNMPLTGLWELKKAILDGDLTEAEDALIKYFEEQFEEIKKSITTQFPHRTHIISSALKAHLRGEYYLSIPVLLAQTDGICKELVSEYFFIKKDKKPRTAIYVEQIAVDTYKAALLSPLATSMPIGASEHEREEGFNLLNRHMVLHGESLNYGSKVNSLKALSLINYVSQALKQDTEYP